MSHLGIEWPASSEAIVIHTPKSICTASCSQKFWLKRHTDGVYRLDTDRNDPYGPHLADFVRSLHRAGIDSIVDQESGVTVEPSPIPGYGSRITIQCTAAYSLREQVYAEAITRFHAADREYVR